MFKRWKIFVSWVMLVSLVTLTACAPAGNTGVTTIQENGREESSLQGTGGSSNEPGESAPGAGAGDEKSKPQGSGLTATYTDPKYQFSVAYPPKFVIRELPAESIADLIPKPIGSITFMNPTSASADFPELEPADLEIRIYNTDNKTSLDDWLAGTTLRSESHQDFQTPNVSGTEICLSTMLVPNCFYFVMGSDWVYGLIPVSLKGESMIETFKLIP